uniref:Cadherin domain-containing protein n=1 Tax=Macrostomum lignano TaxID=282301 RepID=A0A1I8J7T1_9PLAT
AEQQQQPWPKVKITVSNQPVSSYRHRSEGEINNFISQGSTKAVGSLLKGRNDNGQGDFIKIELELTDGYQREFDVDGELIVLLVDTNGTIFGEPPLKVHPWNLKGDYCCPTADNPNDESSGPLSVDPLKEVQQSVRLLFAFVPDDIQMVLNSYAISEPILSWMYGLST